MAFGLSIVKPCFSIVSTKSMVAPIRYGRTHPVGDHLDATEVLDDVTLEVALVEEELVAQPRAAAGLDGNPQREVVTTLALQQRLHLAGGDVGQQ